MYYYILLLLPLTYAKKKKKRSCCVIAYLIDIYKYGIRCPIQSSSCQKKDIDFISSPLMYKFPYLYLIKASMCFTFSCILEVAYFLLMGEARTKSI